MTRNSAKTSDSDDPWGQLEADLFGVDVGKEYTAQERVAAEPLVESPELESSAIPKPLELDDFGDFGAGLVEELEAAARASRSRAPDSSLASGAPRTSETRSASSKSTGSRSAGARSKAAQESEPTAADASQSASPRSGDTAAATSGSRRSAATKSLESGAFESGKASGSDAEGSSDRTDTVRSRVERTLERTAGGRPPRGEKTQARVEKTPSDDIAPGAGRSDSAKADSERSGSERRASGRASSVDKAVAAEKSSTGSSRTGGKSVARGKPSRKKPIEDTLIDFDFDEGPSEEELDASDAALDAADDLEAGDLEAVLDEDADDLDEIEGATAATPATPEDDPYWDALANWNWQEDDRSGKSRESDDRKRSSSDRGAGDRSRNDRGSSDRARAESPRSEVSRGETPRADAPRSDRSGSDKSGRSRSDRPRSDRPRPERAQVERASDNSDVPPVEERLIPGRRVSPGFNLSDLDRPDEVPEVIVPRGSASKLAAEPIASEVDDEEVIPDVASRRRDRRRSRRQGATAAPHDELPHDEVKVTSSEASEAGFDTEEEIALAPVQERSTREKWKSSGARESKPAVASREVIAREAVSEEDLDFDVSAADVEPSEGDADEAADEGAARRKRGRRRRRRPDGTSVSEREAASERGPVRAAGRGVAKSEARHDEDIKHLEDDSFGAIGDEDLDAEGPVADSEEGDTGDERSRRPRRRRRKGRTDRPASDRPARQPAARVEPEMDDVEEDLDLIDEEENPFVDETDLDFESEEAPRAKRSRRRTARPTAAPVVRDVDSDDLDDDVEAADEGEPEPLLSYEDVPSWEEAISFLLNPSMVEGGAVESIGFDRPSYDKGGPSYDRSGAGGDRSASERTDRPRYSDRSARESSSREAGPRENGPRESGSREGGGQRPGRRPRRDS